MVFLRLFRIRDSLVIALLLMPVGLSAATISGTVKDSTGAVIPRARIEIRGGDLAQPVTTNTDGVGHFIAPDLKPGTYIVRVTAEGFEQLRSERASCRERG